MRRLTDFNNPEYAYACKNLLDSRQIDCEVREGDEGAVALWIYDDADLARAQELVATFRAAPYKAKKSDLPQQDPQSDRHQIIDVRTKVFGRGQELQQGLTFTLVGVCGVIFLALRQPQLADYFEVLFFASSGAAPFAEILHGQIWRIVTPIFLHFGWLHIIFNMIWLYQLGSMIETVAGTKKFASIILVAAALSNVFQYWMQPVPFGGMSGVIYGLLAYAWGMGRWQPRSRYFVDKPTFGFMMFWLVICFTGAMGPVANYAHLGGLIVGLIWAYGESGQYKRRRR